MNRVLPTVAALVIAGCLQAGLAPYMSVAGVTPNLLGLVAITLALAEGPTAGAWSGLAAGLLYDLLGTGSVGVMALVLAVTAYLAGMLHEQMFAEGWLLPLTVLAVAALGSELAYFGVLAMLGEATGFWYSLVTRMLPGALYNTTLGLIVYPWLARSLRRDHPMTTFRRLA